MQKLWAGYEIYRVCPSNVNVPPSKTPLILFFFRNDLYFNGFKLVSKHLTKKAIVISKKEDCYIVPLNYQKNDQNNRKIKPKGNRKTSLISIELQQKALDRDGTKENWLSVAWANSFPEEEGGPWERGCAGASFSLWRHNGPYSQIPLRGLSLTSAWHKELRIYPKEITFEQK